MLVETQRCSKVTPRTRNLRDFNSFFKVRLRVWKNVLYAIVIPFKRSLIIWTAWRGGEADTSNINAHRCCLLTLHGPFSHSCKTSSITKCTPSLPEVYLLRRCGQLGVPQCISLWPECVCFMMLLQHSSSSLASRPINYERPRRRGNNRMQEEEEAASSPEDELPWRTQNKPERRLMRRRNSQGC